MVIILVRECIGGIISKGVWRTYEQVGKAPDNPNYMTANQGAKRGSDKKI